MYLFFTLPNLFLIHNPYSLFWVTLVISNKNTDLKIKKNSHSHLRKIHGYSNRFRFSETKVIGSAYYRVGLLVHSDDIWECQLSSYHVRASGSSLWRDMRPIGSLPIMLGLLVHSKHMLGLSVHLDEPRECRLSCYRASSTWVCSDETWEWSVDFLIVLLAY